MTAAATYPYDYLVVGAGLFGSCFARIATDNGHRVKVIDRRPHIGGNCYTEERERIHIHRYGPHIFHTSNEAVWSFINRFATFNNFINSPLALSRGQLLSLPFNMHTFYQLWQTRTPEEAKARIEEQRLQLDRAPANLEEQALTLVGHDIYERLILGYTQKQWQKHPRELPAEIIRRLPVRFTYDCNYFNDRYQGIPVEGYTQVFDKLLQGIDVQLAVDFHESRGHWESQAAKIVYTGKIDELFGFSEGELEYRALKFEDTWHQQRNVQGNAVINYCDADVPWTRMIEHKHFSPQADDPACSVVTKETPMAWSRSETPYYPINNDANMAIYKAYADRAASLDRYILGGRLAEYKYYDMHAVIGSALLRCQSMGLSVDTPA